VYQYQSRTTSSTSIPLHDEQFDCFISFPITKCLPYGSADQRAWPSGKRLNRCGRGLIENPSLALLAVIFRQQILPFLQEYFFEDWTRIQLVLNDHRKSAENRFISPRMTDGTLFGDETIIADKSERWLIN
jgi:hypothetical protein